MRNIEGLDSTEVFPLSSLEVIRRHLRMIDIDDRDRRLELMSFTERDAHVALYHWSSNLSRDIVGRAIRVLGEPFFESLNDQLSRSNH